MITRLVAIMGNGNKGISTLALTKKLHPSGLAHYKYCFTEPHGCLKASQAADILFHVGLFEIPRGKREGRKRKNDRKTESNDQVQPCYNQHLLPHVGSPPVRRQLECRASPLVRPRHKLTIFPLPATASHLLKAEAWPE